MSFLFWRFDDAKTQEKTARYRQRQDSGQTLQYLNRAYLYPLDQALYLFSQQKASHRDGERGDRTVFDLFGSAEKSLAHYAKAVWGHWRMLCWFLTQISK